MSFRSFNVAFNKRVRAWGISRNVLHNKYVLYFTVIISIINLLGMVSMGDLATPLVFVIVGFLTSFFSKNMFVVLALALVVANVLKYGTNMGVPEYVSEGFEDGGDATSPESSGGEPHEIVDTEQYMEKDVGGTSTTTVTNPVTKIHSTSKKMEAMGNQYKKLEGLQKQIIEGMDQVTNSLTQAEKIMQNMQQKTGTKK
jgi:hypothetical protein